MESYKDRQWRPTQHVAVSWKKSGGVEDQVLYYVAASIPLYGMSSRYALTRLAAPYPWRRCDPAPGCATPAGL